MHIVSSTMSKYYDELYPGPWGNYGTPHNAVQQHGTCLDAVRLAGLGWRWCVTAAVRNYAKTVVAAL